MVSSNYYSCRNDIGVVHEALVTFLNERQLRALGFGSVAEVVRIGESLDGRKINA